MADNVVRLNFKEVEMAEDFLKKVKSGEVTHGIICYRTKDGSTKYQLYSPDHVTYILGMMERCKISMVTSSMVN